MKIMLISFFLFFYLLSNDCFSQSIIIPSNLDWQVGITEVGPFNISPYEVIPCVDEVYIDNECGQNYDSPLLNVHFENCEEMVAIWGIEAPENCNYPAQTFWFKRTFQVSELEYINLISSNAKIQGDNSFTFYMNGFEIGSSTPSDWDEDLDFDVTSSLIEGDNEILVEVVNINGGSCFNYAFLAFCLELEIDIETSTNSYHASDIGIKIFPNPASNYLRVLTEENTKVNSLVIYSIAGKLFIELMKLIQMA